jgi:hypothetical protein
VIGAVALYFRVTLRALADGQPFARRDPELLSASAIS